MIDIPGGRYRMGSDRHYPEESPVHEVVVGPFRIDVHPVTNDQFAEFVDDTGYLTFAEPKRERVRLTAQRTRNAAAEGT